MTDGSGFRPHWGICCAPFSYTERLQHTECLYRKYEGKYEGFIFLYFGYNQDHIFGSVITTNCYGNASSTWYTLVGIRKSSLKGGLENTNPAIYSLLVYKNTIFFFSSDLCQFKTNIFLSFYTLTVTVEEVIWNNIYKNANRIQII